MSLSADFPPSALVSSHLSPLKQQTFSSPVSKPQLPSQSTPARKPSFLDYIKPRRAEALARIRRNSFAVVILLITSSLLPLSIVPSPWTCLLFLLFDGGRNPSFGVVKRWGCRVEITLMSIFLFNILQAWFALRYPPPPLPSIDSPAKRAQLRSSTASLNAQGKEAPAMAGKLLFDYTPDSNDDRNKSNPDFSSPYAFSSHSSSIFSTPSPNNRDASFSTNRYSFNQSQSQSPFRSMTKNFTPAFNSSSPFASHLNNQSFGSQGPFVSSPLAGYSRGRRGAGYSFGSAKPMDGNLLSRLQAARDEDE